MHGLEESVDTPPNVALFRALWSLFWASVNEPEVSYHNMHIW